MPRLLPFCFIFCSSLALTLLSPGCSPDEDYLTSNPTPTGGTDGDLDSNRVGGCPELPYPELEETPYVLPYPPGQLFATGLANCSSSFHAAGRPDAYAFDFDMRVGTPFYAIRAGTVRKVVNDESSLGGDGTAGNYLVVDHGDETFALYYHSPENGIEVGVGQEVTQGQRLGIAGRSGYAGYPHLHLIVVRGSYNYPYVGVPVSFKNVSPPHQVLKSNFARGYGARYY